MLVAACLWPVSGELIAGLDERFGPPLDAYVNGSQVWIRDDGPSGEALEWRLHPVPSFRRPDGIATDALFEIVADGVAGWNGSVSPEELWEGLECFAAYGDELDPAALSTAAAAAVGRPPADWGLVDHEAVGDEWERTGGATSIVGALREQLRNPAAS